MTSVVDDKVPGDIGKWDRKFSEKPDEWFFGREPSEMARLALPYWRQSHPEAAGTVLDLGCGEGRDSVYFARHGLRVTSVDGSAAAVDKTARLAAETGVTLADLVCSDVRDFDLERPYDIVHSHNCLQFTGADCPGLLAALQKSSPTGGLHAISVFSNESPDLGSREDLYRFDRNELKFHYRGWRLLFYGEEILWREPAQMYLSFARIIARKA